MLKDAIAEMGVKVMTFGPASHTRYGVYPPLTFVLFGILCRDVFVFFLPPIHSAHCSINMGAL